MQFALICKSDLIYEPMENFLISYSRETAIAIIFAFSGLVFLLLSKLGKKDSSPYNWRALLFFVFLLAAFILSSIYAWQLNVTGECSEMTYLIYLNCQI